MAGRPIWSGQLRISLVSFGIQLFPATSSTSEVSFHQIDRKTHQRVHHLNVINGDRARRQRRHRQRLRVQQRANM